MYAYICTYLQRVISASLRRLNFQICKLYFDAFVCGELNQILAIEISRIWLRIVGRSDFPFCCCPGASATLDTFKTLCQQFAKIKYFYLLPGNSVNAISKPCSSGLVVLSEWKCTLIIDPVDVIGAVLFELQIFRTSGLEGSNPFLT